MGSFYVVRVHTGYEIEAKEMLKAVLNKKNIKAVKSIYAMETVDNVGEDFSRIETELLTDGDISQFLHVKRIQSGLTTLRNAIDNLKQFYDEESLKLLDNYRQTLRDLTAQMREARLNMKKIGAVLQGYILIELESDCSLFPAELIALINSVPKVIGLLDRNNVPYQEVETFFGHLESTSQEIELEFDLPVDFSDLQEVEDRRGELLVKANNASGTLEEESFLKQIDDIELNVSNQVEEIVAAIESEKKPSIVRYLFSHISIKQSRKKEKVKLPLYLFKMLFGKDVEQKDVDRKDRLLEARDRSEFVYYLQKFFRFRNEERKRYEGS